VSQHYMNDSATGEWLRDMRALEAEGERTLQLPVLPGDFAIVEEVMQMTDEERALALLEFKDAA
jgi:hypothetical protein